MKIFISIFLLIRWHIPVSGQLIDPEKIKIQKIRDQVPHSTFTDILYTN